MNIGTSQHFLFISYHYTVILASIMVTKNKCILSFIAFISRPTSLLACNTACVFP